jgi:hypothetical protein
MISVEQNDANTFTVTVDEGGTTTHRVTVPDDYHRKLTGGKEEKEDLVKRSFEFLLERESNQSILGSFELSVIQRYFPEYERTISTA